MGLGKTMFAKTFAVLCGLLSPKLYLIYAEFSPSCVRLSYYPEKCLSCVGACDWINITIFST